MGASVNALPGAEIVPALDRGLIEAAEFNNASSDRALGFPRCLEGLHAAELSPERRAVRGPVQQDQIRRAAGQDEGDHRVRRRMRRRPICHGRRSTATRKTTSSCRPKTRSGFTGRRIPCCRSNSRSSTRWRRRNRPRIPRSKKSPNRSAHFAERAVKWDLDTNVPRRMAYNHYFAKPAAKPAVKKG